MTINIPTIPYSSPQTENIKSESLTDKNPRLFCVPENAPCPNTPPEAIAIIERKT